MKTEYLKTLWMLRFQKMKDAEDQAAWAYQEILDRCILGFGPEVNVAGLLRELVQDERGHAKLAEELLKICQRNHPESGAF